MVIASGIVTSRTSFSFGSAEAWPLSRWVRLTYLVGAQRGDQRETPALFLGANARRRARSGCRSAGATPAARGFIFVGFECETGARPAARSFIHAEALLGDLASLAFGFLVVLAALFLIAFACFRSLAFGTMACFAAGAAAGLFFCNFALFGFTHT